MGLLKIIFLINILFFAAGELLRISIFGVELKIMDISVMIFSTLWLIYALVNKKINKAIYLPSVGFICAGFISLVLSVWVFNFDQIMKGSLYLIRWVSYLSVLTFIFNTENDFKKIIKKLFVFLGGFIVTIGYVQFFFYQSLKNLFYLGWDEHLYRMFSVFLDPNFAGVFFVLYFLFLLDQIFDNFKNRIMLIIYSGLSIFTLFAVLLTYSRSALLMLTFGICFYLFLKKKKILILFIVVSLAILTFILPRAYKTEGTNFFRTVSSEARLISYRQSVEIIKDNPVFGVGFNNYRFAKERHGFSHPRDYKSHSDASSDNSLLFIFATTGIVGLIAYIYMWHRIFILSRKSELILSSIFALFLSSLFINSLFYVFFIYWLFLIIGIKENK